MKNESALKRVALSYFVAACSVTALLFGASQAAAPIVIAGTTYDTVNFADTLISSSSTGGTFSLGGGAATLAAAVTGFDVDTWAFCNCDSAYVQLGFTDNVVTNGPGADLALFEIGTPDNFGISLTVGGVTQTVVSVSTGFTQAQGFGINLATVDLSSFGIAPGASVNSIVVNMGFPFANTSSSPTLAAVTALNATPEPSTMVLLGGGLVAMVSLSRNRRRIRSRA